MMISKSQFKPKALEYFRWVEEKQQKLTITDFGTPVVDIIPHKKIHSGDVLLRLKNSVIKYDDPLEPIGLDHWEALK